MLSQKYREAITETLDVLKHMKKEDVAKIPKSFVSFLEQNAEKNYEVNIDYSIPLQETNIKEETKGILGAIYRSWWCSGEERKEIDRILYEKEKEHQKELREKNNPDDIFNKKKQ